MFSKKGRKRKLDGNIIGIIHRLVKEGLSIRKISKILSIPKSTVHIYIKRINMSKELAYNKNKNKNKKEGDSKNKVSKNSV